VQNVFVLQLSNVLLELIIEQKEIKKCVLSESVRGAANWYYMFSDGRWNFKVQSLAYLEGILLKGALNVKLSCGSYVWCQDPLHFLHSPLFPLPKCWRYKYNSVTFGGSHYLTYTSKL